MNLIGEKGQAFSTFKLLIAAIVAMVILVILLSILESVIFPPTNNPIKSAADSLKSAYQTQSQLVTSQKVTFTKSNNVLSRLTVVEKANIGISPKQVCLSLGDYSGMGDASGFEGGAGSDNENGIVYKLNGSRDVKLSVLCYQGSLLPTIIGTGENSTYPQIKDEWVSNCKCISDDSFMKQTCCLIALRTATN